MNQASHPVRRMCRLLGVSTSGYYAALQRPRPRRQAEDDRLKQAIRRLRGSSAFGKFLGAPRLRGLLGHAGMRVGVKRVARLMREMGISGNPPRPRPKTTIASGKAWRGEDRVRRNFIPAGLRQVFFTDATQIATRGGVAHLVLFQDGFSRRIAGWSVGTRATTGLFLAALRDAVLRCRPEPGLVVHSDRGAQYTSHAFQAELEAHGFLQSVGEAGVCYDNAPSESLVGCCKREAELTTRPPADLEDLERRLREYIDGYYNPRRPHTALGNLSPFRFEAEQRLSNGEENAKKNYTAQQGGGLAPLPAGL